MNRQRIKQWHLTPARTPTRVGGAERLGDSGEGGTHVAENRSCGIDRPLWVRHTGQLNH